MNRTNSTENEHRKVASSKWTRSKQSFWLCQKAGLPVWAYGRGGLIVKQLLFYLKRLPKRFAMAMAVASAVIALPLNSMAAADVRLEGSMGVRNISVDPTSNNQYQESTNASYDQTVEFRVFYHNLEQPDSGKIADDLKVKIDMPTSPNQTQVVKTTISGTNTNTIVDTATVNVGRADAMLEYIPGSAKWQHNPGTRTDSAITETIADNILLEGRVLEDAKPCYEYQAYLYFRAKVSVPGIKVDKFVRVKGETQWSTSNTAKPGDTLQYQIAYKNAGNTVHNKVLIRDNLPPKMQYVAGTTQLKNDGGLRNVADGVTTTGIYVGNYNPGAAAYVLFEVKVPSADQLACGKTEFRNVGVARPEGMNEFYNTAITVVNKECANVPAYSCDLLKVTKGDNRTITISEFKTSAANGATFKDVVISWGDNSDNLTTNNPVGQKHQYAKDGEYTITATARFNVNGQVKEAKSDACVVKVNFAAPTAPTPTVLPNTGAGSVAGIFAAVTAAGAMAHRIVLARRLS
jgi:uncharacterized repeat protein (TIGR01451 family)